MSEHRSEIELLANLASLPREMPPANDQWAGIAARISPQLESGASGKRIFSMWPVAIAASLVAVASLTFVFFQPVHELSVENLSADGPAYPPGSSVGNASRAAAETEYLAAFREFMALNDLDVHMNSLAVKEFDSGWNTLQQAETELSAALAAEPENPFLTSRMNHLRARQLELLQKVAAVEMAARRNSI